MNCEFLVGAMLLDPKTAPDGLGSLASPDMPKPFAKAGSGRTQRFAPTGFAGSDPANMRRGGSFKRFGGLA